MPLSQALEWIAQNRTGVIIMIDGDSGVEFIPENGGGAGVRLRKASQSDYGQAQ